jgi:hypothetical protein
MTEVLREGGGGKEEPSCGLGGGGEGGKHHEKGSFRTVRARGDGFSCIRKDRLSTAHTATSIIAHMFVYNF